MIIKPTEALSLNHDKEADAYIEDVSVEYSSEVNDEVQILKVFTENNGVARYMNISTEKYSFSDIDELIEILKDFKKRASL